MNKAEVMHLAKLSRLELSEQELDSYTKDFTDILGFFDILNETAQGGDKSRGENPEIKNVFREDGEPHETGIYTEKIISQAPDHKDGFIKVKPILKND